jgi:hypothetical protein
MALSAEDHTNCTCVDPLNSSDRSPSQIRPIGALDESELRRVVDVIAKQFEKQPCAKLAKIGFAVSFANGAVSRDTNIENILRLENGGSEAITAL